MDIAGEIVSFKELVDTVIRSCKKGRQKHLAVAWGEDPYTLKALDRAVGEGIAAVSLLGERTSIERVCRDLGIDPARFTIISADSPEEACGEAVAMVKHGDADILMKGLVNSDTFLKAVMRKGEGLLPPGAVLTYTGILEIPSRGKLLLISDPAVIPFPTLEQKKAMILYSVAVARRLGIAEPRVALVSCTEKVTPAIPNTVWDAELTGMNRQGLIPGCIVDGPLDIFLACDPAAGAVKGVDTPIGGEADLLIFPSLEAANSFYKGLMLFAGAELAGLLRGTEKPVVLMSRSESPASKFYCIALAALLADSPSPA